MRSINFYRQEKIFSKKIELFNLMLPILFLGLLAYELIFLKKKFITIARIDIYIIINIVFLNVLHNVFTICLLASTKKIEPWFIHQGGVKKYIKKHVFLLIIFMALSAFFFYFGKHNPYITLLFRNLTFSLAAHHAISQIFGLSNSYNSLCDIQNRNILKIERLFFNLFLTLNLLLGNLFFIQRSNLFYNYNQFISNMNMLFAGGLVLISLCLILLPFFMKSKTIYNKIIFNLRCLLWPFSFMSFVASNAVNILHGFEYAFVTHKIVKKGGFVRKHIAFFIILIFIFFSYIRTQGVYYFYSQIDMNWMIHLITYFSLAITFLHYYMDREIFRMRKKENQLLIKPLLLAKD